MNDEEREYLNEMIRGLNNQLVDALRERDEARRMCCLFQSRLLGSEPLWWSRKQGWDCFKEDGK